MGFLWIGDYETYTMPYCLNDKNTLPNPLLNITKFLKHVYLL